MHINIACVLPAKLTNLRLNHQLRTVMLNAQGKTMTLLLADIYFAENQEHSCLLIQYPVRYYQYDP